MDDTTFRLSELTAQISRAIRRKSRVLPLAPYLHRALRVIAIEPIRPARLAEALNVSPRAVTGVVDSLTELGFVESHSDPNDRRAKVVETTSAGQQFLASTAAKRADIANDVFGTLTLTEQSELLHLLEKVEEATRE